MTSPNQVPDFSKSPEVDLLEEIMLSPGPSSGNKRSWVHQYYELNSSKMLFSCKLCKQHLKEQKGKSTGNLHNHLRLRHHDIYLKHSGETNSVKKPKLVQPSLKEYTETMSMRKSVFSRNGFIDKLMTFIVETDQPISIVEKKSFRELIAYVSLDSEKTELPGRTWMTSKIKQKYEDAKSRLIQELTTQPGKVSLILDGWTSSNQIAFQGVIVRFIDAEWNLKTVPIDLTILSGPHSGENIANSFVEVLEEFKILDKIVSITTDNASNMDTFFAVLTSLMESKGMVFDPFNQRVRCLGHILNLCARSAIDGFEDGEHMGLIEKLRKGITGIRSSPQRREIFKNQSNVSRSDDLLPTLDCKTRWNTTHEMICRAIAVKEGFQATLQSIKDLKPFQLIDYEWEILQKLMEFLEPLKEATLMISKETAPNIAASTLIYQYLFDHFETFSSKPTRKRQTSEKNYDWLSPLAEAAIKKLEKYYPDSDGKAYIIGTVLHPGFKLEWYKQTKWPLDWIKKCTNLITNEWVTHYKPKDVDSTLLSQNPVENQDFFGSLYYKQMSSCVKGPVDELKKFLSDPIVPHDSLQHTGLLGWWKNHEIEFPALSKMARNFFTVAGSGVPVESLFSKATDILTDNRQSLLGENLKILLCLKCWSNSF